MFHKYTNLGSTIIVRETSVSTHDITLRFMVLNQGRPIAVVVTGLPVSCVLCWCVYFSVCHVTPLFIHDDIINWKHFPRNWPFVRGIHRSPVNSPHKGQWHGALMFSVICVWINDWVNTREAGDLRRYGSHYDVIVMSTLCTPPSGHTQW